MQVIPAGRNAAVLLYFLLCWLLCCLRVEITQQIECQQEACFENKASEWMDDCGLIQKWNGRPRGLGWMKANSRSVLHFLHRQTSTPGWET